jgi:hypothetical protein
VSETLPPGSQAAPKYWAFISYSHRDESWARWLHTALETYRIPAAVAQGLPAPGGTLATDRIYPVFRDRDELGHLVMALGDAAAVRASSNWTFEAAEMLIGLSAMPAPVR